MAASAQHTIVDLIHMGFCVKCGKKGIEGSLCSECFKEENPVLKEFKEMRIEVCRNCKAFRNHGR